MKPDGFYTDIEEDMWAVLGISMGGYSAAVDQEIVAVIKAVAETDYDKGIRGYVSDVAYRTNLSQNHVELVQYILCSAGLAEYGTSPRGCWIDHDIDKYRLLAALDAYMKRWEEE